MDENFKKCKAKLIREFYLKISLISLAIGLTVSGLIILFTRLFSLSFPYYISIAIGVVILIGSFLALAFLKKPNDEKIAERIDSDFKLQEKVTSMVAFQDKSGLLYEKQREDAKEQLSKKNVKKLPVKLAMINIPALVFGASLFTASFFTPNVIKNASKDNKPDKGTVNDKTEEIIDTIHDIINNSDASAAFKEELNQILEDLLVELQDDTDVLSRMKKVIIAEGKVDAALDRANSKEEIGSALENSTIDLLAKLGTAIKNGDQDEVSNILQQLEKHFAPRSVYTGDTLCDHIESIASAIKTAIDESLEAETPVKKEDGLYLALNNLSTSLSSINKNFSKYLSGDTENGITEDQAKSDSIEAIEVAISEICSCLQAQQENSDLADQVKAYMESLIDPTNSGGGESENGDQKTSGTDGEGESGNNQNNSGDGQGEKSDGDGDGDSGDKDDSEQDSGGDSSGDSDSGDEGDSEGKGDSEGNEGDSSGGGSGKGESEGEGSSSSDGASGGSGKTNYGSSDTVYTDDNGYSEYGDVIDGYHNDAVEDNKENGNDETGDLLDDYFNSLYGNDSDNNNP